MILHPAVLALLLIALLVSGMGIYAGYYGMRILARWDPAQRQRTAAGAGAQNLPDLDAS